MPSTKMALTAGIIAFIVGTVAYFLLPHFVDSEIARGTIGALVTGFGVYFGLTALKTAKEST